MSGENVTKNPGERFVVIDGLRGIAALLVVVHHLSEVAGLRELPHLHYLFEYGSFGVEVFFVISGFVIAYSVRNANHTAMFLGRFALRRSVRLDPPYWVTILVEITLLKIGMLIFPGHLVYVPQIEDIAMHIIYMQDIMAVPQILPVFWTLCYEVQFYFALVGSLVVITVVGRHVLTLNREKVMWALGGVSFLYSVAIDAGVLPLPMAGLFLDRWYQFLLGVVTLAVFCGWCRARVAFVTWGAMLAILLVSQPSAYTYQSAFACVLASALILVSRRITWIFEIMQSPALQFLGRISYSLYLIHLVVGWRFVSATLRVLPDVDGVAFRALIFALGVMLSVLCAHLMCSLIERPSIRLASRIRAT